MLQSLEKFSAIQSKQYERAYLFFSKATTFEQKVNHRKCKHQSMENDGYEDATLFSVHSNTNKIRRNCFISFLT